MRFETASLLHLSTVAAQRNSNQPWVKFQSAGWVNIQSAPTAFTREPFELMFYNDFWLEKKYESLGHVLTAMEVLRDSIVERSANAETKRAGFRIVDSEG
jgi:hypothetical protein